MKTNSLFRSLCSSVVVRCAALLTVCTAPAKAQFGLGGIVLDPSNLARNVLHYARRLEQMDMERQQLQQQIAAMRKLQNPNWRQISGAMSNIDAIMKSGQALAYSLNTIDADFRSTFPGAEPFQNYPSEQRNQATRTLATLRGALNAASRAASDFPSSLSRLQAIKSQVASVQGHEQALELNGTIGMYSAEELTLLRQAIGALTNVQAVYNANEVNSRSQETATYRAHLAAMSGPGRPTPITSLRVTP